MPVDQVAAFQDRLILVEGVGHVESVGAVAGVARLIAVPAGDADILAKVGEAAAAANLPVGAVEAEPARLDDAFREITT